MKKRCKKIWKEVAGHPLLSMVLIVSTLIVAANIMNPLPGCYQGRS